MASTTTPTLVPAMGCDAQNTRRIATKRATPDSDGERPDAKRRRAVAEEASLHAKKTYDEHVAAAALGDEESRSHRELDAVKELVERYMNDPIVSRWTCCATGIPVDRRVFGQFELHGACGINGVDKLFIEFGPGFDGYVRALGHKGGFSEEGDGFDRPDAGFEFAISNINEYIRSDYESRFDKVVEGIAELYEADLIATTAVTFALNSCGRVCKVFLH